MGDLAPEMLKYVPASDSGNGKALLLASCEVSGSFVVYELTYTAPAVAATDNSFEIDVTVSNL